MLSNDPVDRIVYGSPAHQLAIDGCEDESQIPFYKYSQKPDVDPVRDKLALSMANFNLTDEEMDSFINDISEIMKKYDEISTKSKGRLRNVSLILSPAEDGEESGTGEEKEES